MIDTYVDLDECKRDLSLTNDKDDAILESYILEAKDFIDSYLDYTWGQEGTEHTPVSKAYSGLGNNRITISPMLSLATCVMNDVDITDKVILPILGDSTYATTLYYRSGIFSSGIANIVVSGIWGRCYDNDAIPSDIVRCAKRLVIHFYKMRKASYADAAGNRSMGQVKYNGQIPQDIIEILNKRAPVHFVSHSSVPRTSLYELTHG